MLDFIFNKTPLYFFTQSFWRDEGFTYLMAKQGIVGILTKTATDFNPPFYYLIMNFWIFVFGKSEIAMRGLSFIFYAISIYFFYLILERVLKIKGKIIWVYLILFVINPLVSYFAFEARMYSLFSLLTIMSFYFFLTKDYKKYLLFSILGIYTHYFFIFVILTQIIYSIFFDREHLKIEAKYFIWIFILFIPWFVYVAPSFFSKTNSFWMEKTNWESLVQSLGILYTGYEKVYGFFDKQILLTSLFLIIFVIYSFFFIKKKTKLFYLFFLWGIFFYLLTLLISFTKPIFVPRYLIFSISGFLLFIIYCLEHFSTKAKIIFLSILFLITFFYLTLEPLHKRKGDLKGTIAKIKKMANPRDYLYVSNPATYFVAVYYFDENKVFVYGKNYSEIPEYVGLSILPKDKFINRLPNYPSKAFILINDYDFEVQSNL